MTVKSTLVNRFGLLTTTEHDHKTTANKQHANSQLTGRTLSPWRRPSTGFSVSNTWPYLALSSTCQQHQTTCFHTTTVNTTKQQLWFCLTDL